MRREDEEPEESEVGSEEYCDPQEEDSEEEVSLVAPSVHLKKGSVGSEKDREGGALRSGRASKTHASNLELEGSRSLGSRHFRRHKMKSSREARPSCDSPVLKLELPTFKGGKKVDPYVHNQVFESWANMRGIKKADNVSYFHCSIKGEAQQWYYHYPPSRLSG